MTAAVDVVVPCHNYGRHLRECTASVLQETRLPVRVLIIDDASSDDSAAEAQRIADEDPRVHVVAHAANRGHIATYNEGIDWVEAPYMLLLSADDLVAPGALFRAVELMEQNPNVAFVFGDATRFSTPEPPPVRPAAASAGVIPGLQFIRSLCEATTNPVETATADVRSAVQKHVGGYRRELPHTADLEMWLRCATQGDVGHIGATQAFVRIHARNMHHDYAGQNLAADFLQRRDAFALFFETFGAAVPGAEDLERQVNRRLADDLFGAAVQAYYQERPYRPLLDAVLAVDPAIRRRSDYGRIRLKIGLRSMLGERAWGRLRALRTSWFSVARLGGR
jgi:glycosyltransferase involved in cell wall biosynthesis